MISSTVERMDSVEAQAKAAKQTFFRQSSWMMSTSLASGVFMFAVHLFSDKIGGEQYGVFGTLLAILSFLGIPAVGLQMVFARQAAAALGESEKRRLSRTVRIVGLWLFLIWVAFVIGLVVWSQRIGTALEISPTALWVTVSLTAITLSKPVTFGVLQGKQDFLWMGWASILAGVGRFSLVALFVLAFGGGAAAVMLAALLGELLALSIAITRTRDVWAGVGEPVDWKNWLGKMVPLTLGFAAFQFMYTADPMFMRSFLDKKQSGGFVAAGTLSRALVLFTGQIAAVMFPKIVRSIASGQKSDMFKLTFLATAALAGLGAIFIAYILPIGLRFFFKESFVAGIPLLPPFAFTMAILTLDNVLINNLLAQEKFKAVPWLVIITVGYAMAVVFKFHQSAEQIIYTLGTFSVLLLGVALFFTWRESKAPVPA